MQGSTGKFAEIRLMQNRLKYAEFRTLVNSDEHVLSDLKSVQCRCEVTSLLKAQETEHHGSSVGLLSATSRRYRCFTATMVSVSAFVDGVQNSD